MANDMARVPRLTGDPDHDINELQRVISLGGNVDNYKRGLRYYLRNNVKIEPDIDPVLQNLPAAIAKRVATLESYLQMPEYKVDAINIEAVKAAYIDGSLEIRPGHWTFWVGGRQKSSYVNSPTAIGPIPHEVFQRWIEEENGYRVWMEHPGEPFSQMAAYTSFPPSNLDDHHLYDVFLNLPGANGNGIVIPVLDDTGSSFIEIFDTDRVNLGIFPALLHIHPPVTLITASVPVQRSVIFLKVKIIDQTNAPIGDWVNVMAVVVPGPPTRGRCSGMFVRKSFFTATAPDAQGLLHVAAKKNGIIRHLPVV